MSTNCKVTGAPHLFFYSLLQLLNSVGKLDIQHEAPNILEPAPGEPRTGMFLEDHRLVFFQHLPDKILAPVCNYPWLNQHQSEHSGNPHTLPMTVLLVEALRSKY